MQSAKACFGGIKNQTNNGVRVRSVLRAIFQEFCLDWAHFAGPGVVELLVVITGGLEVFFVHLRRSLFDRKRPSVVEVARSVVRVTSATGLSPEVA